VQLYIHSVTICRPTS